MYFEPPVLLITGGAKSHISATSYDRAPSLRQIEAVRCSDICPRVADKQTLKIALFNVCFVPNPDVLYRISGISVPMQPPLAAGIR